MTESLVYRMKRRGDESALVDLWNEHSGWGQLDEDWWNELMLIGLGDEAPVVVAEDPNTGKIVAQLPFIPRTVSVRGRRIRAFRVFAAILATAAREAAVLNPSAHPMIRMYRFGVETLSRDGCGLIYFLPKPTWLAVTRMAPSIRCHLFPQWKLWLPAERILEMPAGYSIVRTPPTWDERVADLQAAASRRRPCLVWRNASIWRRKAHRTHLQATGVERDGVLMGLVLQKRNRIGDVLTMDDEDSLRATLTAACNVAQERSGNIASGQWLEILALPAFQPVLSDLGFTPGDYRYPLVVHPLDSTLSADEIEPRDWHITLMD